MAKGRVENGVQVIPHSLVSEFIEYAGRRLRLFVLPRRKRGPLFDKMFEGMSILKREYRPYEDDYVYVVWAPWFAPTEQGAMIPEFDVIVRTRTIRFGENKDCVEILGYYLQEKGLI